MQRPGDERADARSRCELRERLGQPEHLVMGPSLRERRRPDDRPLVAIARDPRALERRLSQPADGDEAHGPERSVWRRHRVPPAALMLAQRQIVAKGLGRWARLLHQACASRVYWPSSVAVAYTSRSGVPVAPVAVSCTPTPSAPSEKNVKTGTRLLAAPSACRGVAPALSVGVMGGRF